MYSFIMVSSLPEFWEFYPYAYARWYYRILRCNKSFLRNVQIVACFSDSYPSELVILILLRSENETLFLFEIADCLISRETIVTKPRFEVIKETVTSSLIRVLHVGFRLGKYLESHLSKDDSSKRTIEQFNNWCEFINCWSNLNNWAR